MRRYLLAALLLLVPLQGQGPDPFFDKMVAFENHWGAFKLEYLGCPSHSYQTDSTGRLMNCSGAGSMDYQKFKKARRAAEILFDLQPR